jgi:hypothetical protein
MRRKHASAEGEGLDLLSHVEFQRNYRYAVAVGASKHYRTLSRHLHLADISIVRRLAWMVAAHPSVSVFLGHPAK